MKIQNNPKLISILDGEMGWWRGNQIPSRLFSQENARGCSSPLQPFLYSSYNGGWDFEKQLRKMSQMFE